MEKVLNSFLFNYLSLFLGIWIKLCTFLKSFYLFSIQSTSPSAQPNNWLPQTSNSTTETKLNHSTATQPEHSQHNNTTKAYILANKKGRCCLLKIMTFLDNKTLGWGTNLPGRLVMVFHVCFCAIIKWFVTISNYILICAVLKCQRNCIRLLWHILLNGFERVNLDKTV